MSSDAAGAREVPDTVAAPEPSPIQPTDPRRIGPFKVLARLGQGGMGTVYLAESGDGVRAAVKVILPELAEDQEYLARFRRETQAAQAVRSPHLAAVLGSDPDAQPPWLATEYVPYPSLKRRVARGGPLSEASVRRLVADVAQALAAIHAAGLVHRDIKPDNILFGADGARVIDMGIARPLDGTSFTRTGHHVGTYAYMAPEQAIDGKLSTAVDVWALGLVAHFAATGRWPFGEGGSKSLRHLFDAEAPDLETCPDYLRPLVGTCLAREPGARPTAQEILDAADDWSPLEMAAAETVMRPAEATPIDAVAPSSAASSAAAAGAATTPPTGPGRGGRSRRRRTVLAVGTSVATVAVIAGAATLIGTLTHHDQARSASDHSASGAAAPSGASSAASGQASGANVPGGVTTGDDAMSAGPAGSPAGSTPGAPQGAAPGGKSAPGAPQAPAVKTVTAGKVAISGSAVYTHTLTAAPSGWSPTPTSRRCTWYRDTTRLATDGSCRYTVQLGDIDHRLKVAMTGSASGYRAASASSGYTSTVTKPWISFGNPKLTGTFRVGRTVTCTTEQRSNVTYTFKFFRRSSNGPVQFGGTRRSSTAKSSATVPKAARGWKIFCQVLPTKTGYQSDAHNSAAVGPVKAAS